MAKREPINTQLLHDRMWSKYLNWHVSLHVDHRGNVVNVSTSAQYGEAGNYLYGHAQQDTNPFDDLVEVIRTTMVDAAVKCSEQLVLFHQP